MRKTIRIWRVTAGTLSRDYFTDYHAEQYANALRRHEPLRDVPVTITALRVPNDPLTRLVTS